MATEFSAQTADGTTDTITKTGPEIKSGILAYKKTGTGTCTISVKNGFNDAVLGSANIALAANAQSGNVEFPLSSQCYIELSSVSGSVSVDSQIDGYLA